MSTSPAVTSPSVTTTNVSTSDSSAPAKPPAPAASLLPVNPFPRRDISPQVIHPIPPPLVSPPDRRNHLDSVPITINNNTSMDVSHPGNYMMPITLDLPPRQLATSTSVPISAPIVICPQATEVHQTEALDFSLKSEPNIQNASKRKPVFPLGVVDPKDTLLRSDTDCNTVVDLSCRPPNSQPNVVTEDDTILMKQEYPDRYNAVDSTSEDDFRRCSDDNALASSKTEGHVGKRRSTFLDKMVEKLWQSKKSKSDDEDKQDDGEETDEVVAKAPSCAAMPNDSSFGRVYVLNPLPEQTNNCSMNIDSTMNMMKQSTVKSESTINKRAPAGNLQDSALQAAAASIAGAVMGEEGLPSKHEEDEDGFCAIKFHTCRVCKQLFYSAEAMWEHAVTHEDFHKYKCSKCNYVTACHRELVNHKLLNHSPNMEKHGRHTCSYPGCMRSYSEWRHLKEHQKAHDMSDTPHLSPFKGSQEQSPGTPTKDGRLVCDYAGCYKTFKEWRHLKVHQTLHTGEKPLSCQLCSYACRHRSSMNWHMKSKHGLDKMKTQGNRTVYVDSNRRVVCGWSDEANREVNYLKEMPHQRGQLPGSGADMLRDLKHEVDNMSDFSSITGDMTSFDNSRSVSQAGGSTSASMCSSRPPSCAPSDNPSERSLMDDPHMLMLKMQAKPNEFPLNMSVHVEDMSPKGDRMPGDGRMTSKLMEESDKLNNRLLIDLSHDRNTTANGSRSPVYTSANMSPSISSTEASSMVSTEGRTLVMTPVAMANIGQGSDNQASMMKFKLKYLVAPKYFSCKICNNNFDSATKMWEHRIREHNDCTKFYCDSCGFVTEHMQELQGHMLSTHGKEMGGMKDHICFICGKGYATKTGLNQHLLRHSEDGPPHFDCPYENCASKVHSKCALKNHIRRVHLKVPAKYVCQEEGCLRRFESSSALRNHQVLHTEQRPLMCDFGGCDKTFRETKHLKVHRMQHTDEKPIKCEMCNYSCRQRNSMNWHMKSKHGCEKSVTPDGRTMPGMVL